MFFTTNGRRDRAGGRVVGNAESSMPQWFRFVILDAKRIALRFSHGAGNRVCRCCFLISSFDNLLFGASK